MREKKQKINNENAKTLVQVTDDKYLEIASLLEAFNGAISLKDILTTPIPMLNDLKNAYQKISEIKSKNAMSVMKGLPQ